MMGTAFSRIDRHFKALITLVFVLTVSGVLAGLAMPVALFPAVTFPRLVVSAEVGALPADQVVVQVTKPLEEALANVPGIGRVRSTSSRGAAELSASFAWGTDMLGAFLLSQAAVNQAQAVLPAGTVLTVRRMDPTVFPVIGYSLTSAKRTQASLREMGVQTLRPLLMRVPGVARVSVLGGDQREVQVRLDPAKLLARGLTASGVADAVTKANVLSSGGLMESGLQLYLTLVDGRAPTAEAIAALPVASVGGQAIGLGEVAEVVEAVAPRWTRVTADGRDAVLINIYQQPGGNTVKIAAAVQQMLKEASGQWPTDVAMHQFYDQSELISESMGSVRDSILVGIGLGIIVIWAFVRRWRLTLLAAVVVPVCLGITVLILYLLGLTFNVMTLGGMAAAVGLILDDAIVMVETVSHHLQLGKRPAEAGADAIQELTVPFIGATAASLVVHIPLAFLSGVTGAFFASLSITIVAALTVSLGVSLWLLPSLAARVLRPQIETPRPESAATRLYRRVLGVCLRQRIVVTVVTVLLVIGGVWLYGQLPTGFLPQMDEGAFVLDYRTPAGTSLKETDRILRRIETELQHTPEIASYSRRTGLQLGGGLSEANEGDFLVKLHKGNRKALDEVIAEVRSRTEPVLPGTTLEFVLLMEDLVGDLTAVPQPIEVKVFGGDMVTNQRVAREIAALLPDVPGVVDVVDGIIVSGGGLRATLDPVAAGRYGVTTAEVATAVQLAVSGQVSSTVLRGEQVVGIRVRTGVLPPADAAALAEVPVMTASGRPVRLGQVARIVDEPGLTQIQRENLKPMVAVTARLEGVSLGGTVDRVRATLARKLQLPPGVSLEFGGLYEEQQRAFQGLLMVIAAAVALVLGVLLVLFGGFRIALTVTAVSAVSVCGSLAALALTGTALNVSSLMGVVMVVGIVAENAVFCLYEAHQAMAAGREPGAALLAAGSRRLRPVSMTVVAAILALLPLAMGWGAGAQMQRPLAIAVIGGLALSGPLILLVLPALTLLGTKAPAQTI
ncbi:MAG: efflux RND transporter permease subunit [Candidatus Sericytochromatia bacterium]|nr:efflux RND transporter permease subunit [Candidatus Sericytochromatia bacterium]